MAKPKGKRMKNKKLLAIILLSLSFCFVSGVGYGEEMTMKQVREAVVAQKASQIDLILLGVVLCFVVNGIGMEKLRKI